MKSIVSGSYNIGTVIDALKLMGKRVAGIITVVIMVHDAGACLGWWDMEPIDRNEEDPSVVNVNAIPIDFFLGSVFYYDLHWNSIVNHLQSVYGITSVDQANEIINTVISYNGDPSYVGTAMIESYFFSLN